MNMMKLGVLSYFYLPVAFIGVFPLFSHAETFAPAEASTFLVGSGYNSITGSVRANCVAISDLASLASHTSINQSGAASSYCTPSGQCVEFRLSQVNSSKDLRKALDVDVKASFGFAAVSADASTQYYDENRYTNENIYIVLKVKVTNITERLRELNLVDWARELLASGDTNEFLRRCGDSFVAARTTGGEFTALIKIETTSEENKNKIQARLSGSGITWSASGDVESTLTEIKKTNSLEIRMFKKGGIGALPEHNDIKAVFAFARNIPVAVQSNASPMPYLISTMDYGVVSNSPRENTSLVAQRRILENIATNRDRAFELWGDAQFILNNRDQFEEFDNSAIVNYRRAVSDIVDTLVESALSCEENPLQCSLPDIIWPEITLPKRLVQSAASSASAATSTQKDPPAKKRYESDRDFFDAVIKLFYMKVMDYPKYAVDSPEFKTMFLDTAYQAELKGRGGKINRELLKALNKDNERRAKGTISKEWDDIN